jgi:hypothetical protein
MNKITRKREMKPLFYIKQSSHDEVSNFESFWNGLRKRNKIRRYLKNKGVITEF